MSRSMTINFVRAGGLGFADRLACEENDPLALLIEAEDSGEEEINSYPTCSTHCAPRMRSAEEI